MISARKVQNVGGERNSVGDIHGTYRGQSITLIRDTDPSAIQLASAIAGFEATKQKLRPPILQRHVVSKKFFKEKEKILATYTERLGQNKQTRQYKEVFAELSRQRYKREYRGEDQQDALRDALLYKVAENFGEVTEQDNVLEFAIATHPLEREVLETEIVQVKKIIEFFTDPPTQTINIGFANSERIKWSEKLAALEDSLETGDAFKTQLLRARELLQKTHKQAIRDGYNLIPKAAAVLSQGHGDGGTQSAISLAVTYRDEVLKMANPLDVFETFIRRQEKKRESFRPYIDSMIALFGIDIASSNPSRSQEELRHIRDGLFRIEICGQIYDSVGALGGNTRRMFPGTAHKQRQ
ncbi:MAG: hypothetical protein LBJ81_02125 [Puniceicoccales bacterium]|jgi:hypothetical protein|nr:hypothetical protein [Puniceicoccales bacterium]